MKREKRNFCISKDKETKKRIGRGWQFQLLLYTQDLASLG